jgi:hypothetical protein
VQRVRYNNHMDETKKKEPPRLVIEIDSARREKFRIVAVLKGRTMRDMVEEFIDSLPDPPKMD